MGIQNPEVDLWEIPGPEESIGYVGKSVHSKGKGKGAEIDILIYDSDLKQIPDGMQSIPNNLAKKPEKRSVGGVWGGLIVTAYYLYVAGLFILPTYLVLIPGELLSGKWGP